MSSTSTFAGTLVYVECCAGVVIFGMAPDMKAQRRNDHGWSYFPQRAPTALYRRGGEWLPVHAHNVKDGFRMGFMMARQAETETPEPAA